MGSNYDFYDRGKFKVRFELINKNLLYIKFIGYANKEDTVFVIEKIDALIKDLKSVVLIQDVYELVSNTVASRITFIKASKRLTQIIATIYIGTSQFQKFKVATAKKLYNIPIPLIILDEYDQAIKKASELIKNFNLDNVKINGIEYFSKFHYEINNVSENIFYLSIIGNPDYKDIYSLMKTIIKRIGDRNVVIVINLYYLNDISLRSRIAYINALKVYNNIIGFVFIGASDEQKIKIKLLNKINNFNIIISKDYTTAIEEAEKLFSNNNKKNLLIKKNKNVTIEDKLLSENILYIKIKGILTYKTILKIINEKFLHSNKVPIVLIIDLTDLRLMTPRALRVYTKEVGNYNIIARVFINVPKILFKQTEKRRRESKIPILITDNYNKALIFSKKILNEHNKNSSYKKWNIRIKKLKIDVSLITNKILYLKYYGSIDLDSIDTLFLELNNIFDYIQANSFVIIQDIENIKFNIINKKRYIDFYKKINRIDGMILLGALNSIKLRVKIANFFYFINFPIIVADNYSHAIREAYNIIDNEDRLFFLKYRYIENSLLNNIFRITNERYIQDINRYLFSAYKNQNEILSNNFIENHPFKMILESFKVIVADINELMLDYDKKETELTLLKTKLEYMNFDLELKVGQRKVKLAKINRELKKEIRIRKESEKKNKLSKEIAEKNNLTKNIFLSKISGHLKDSVDDILSIIEEVKNSNTRNEMKKNLSKIINNTKAISLEINNLITHSQFESGNMSCNLEINDINLLIKEVLEKLDDFKKEKFIIIDYFNKTSDTIFKFDKEKIKNLIEHLIKNAIKYTPLYGEVTITLLSLDNKIKLIIKDSGVGIHPKKITSIFEDFTQNLGLIISKQIVFQHNGEIWAKNNKETGVSFIFTLPLKK